jgi:type IV fimbrial biogenesis protein FimT
LFFGAKNARYNNIRYTLGTLMIFKKKNTSNHFLHFTCLLNNTGFSLAEVLTVIGLIAIISAIAIPNYIAMLPDYRLKDAARTLFSSMQKAKLEAVKRNTNVAISFSVASGSYEVFVDDGAGGGTSGDATKNGAETTLIQRTLPAGCSIVSASFIGAPRTGFTSQALPLGNRIGTVQLRNNKTRHYTIAISNSGHIKLRVSTDNGATFN